ncbi:hypothetical protein G6F24_016966 [Rhizopus arrhizus]|nr:hypothetical protein G6F24_016966 [Rhizopus arrhizus]
MRSVVLSKPTPTASSSPTILTSSGSDRPSRSSRHTTNESPLRAKARASASPGRSAFAPLAVSGKTFSQPAAVRASRWRSIF